MYFIDTKIGMYERIDQMTPFYPGEGLSDIAIELIQKSAALDGRVAARTAQSLADLMLHANSYYSNLIERQHTRPLEVEASLHNPARAKNELVELGTAHIRTEQAARRKVEAGGSPYDVRFILWLHKEFYAPLPEPMKTVAGKNKTGKVVPGAWREDDVEVGEHVAPRHQAMPALMKEFIRVYEPVKNKALTLSRIAAAHHRFVWIHPFLDGNGRVGRLLTHAWLRSAGAMGTGLWSISRGLARQREAYLTHLRNADHPRQGDLDGRGNLSQRALDEFCEFMLKTAIDQVEFMRDCFRFDTLEQRLHRAFAEFAISIPGLREEGWRLVWEAINHGEFERGDAPRITGLGERVARDLLSTMLEHSLLASDPPRGRKVYVSFPLRAVSWYFPELFPPGDVIEYGKQLDIDAKQKSATKIPIAR